MPKAYAYVRWSTAEQGEEGRDSHDRQTTPLRAFTEATGIPVVETIIDNGVSAFKGANARIGQLKVLLDRIERGEIEQGDYVIVESIDRLTRQKLNDSVDLIQSILKKGVRLHTVIDQKTYSHDDPSRDLEILWYLKNYSGSIDSDADIHFKRLQKLRSASETIFSTEAKNFIDGLLDKMHQMPVRRKAYENEITPEAARVLEGFGVDPNIHDTLAIQYIETKNYFSREAFTEFEALFTVKA